MFQGPASSSDFKFGLLLSVSRGVSLESLSLLSTDVSTAELSSDVSTWVSSSVELESELSTSVLDAAGVLGPSTGDAVLGGLAVVGAGVGDFVAGAGNKQLRVLTLNGFLSSLSSLWYFEIQKPFYYLKVTNVLSILFCLVNCFSPDHFKFL